MSNHVYRFAPSPNGYLHLGHAYSAILNHDMAADAGGRFLLRIEDIDIHRCKLEYEAAIHEDLAWLGLQWERPVRRQSDQFADYAAALERLKALNLVYPAVLSRKEIDAQIALLGPQWPRDPDGVPHYPGDEREMPPRQLEAEIGKGREYAWRLNMKKAAHHVGRTITWIESGTGHPEMIKADPLSWGDVIIARKDTPTSYHLSVVVDDALQGVTDVVRGRDLYHATSVHRLLQMLLDLPEPRYHHHALIEDTNGVKLSKSMQSKSLRHLRAEGIDPVMVRHLLGLHSGEDGLGNT